MDDLALFDARDRTADPYGFFLERRRAELRPLITDELIEEHHNNPRGLHGHHSNALQEVLNFLRMMPVAGEPFVFVAEPHRRYLVGTLSGRGQDPAIDPNRCFDNETEAVHAVFLDRLKHFGLLSDLNEANFR